MDTGTFNTKRYSVPYEKEMNVMTHIRIKKMISLLVPSRKLLDVGCWDGYIMQKIEESKKAKEIIGIDNSRSAIKTALKKGLKARLIESVDMRLPFKNNEFDTVMAGETIEHLYDVNTFLSEMNRILKPGGQFILTTPNLASFGSRITLLSGKIPWMIENELTEKSSGHIRYFTFNSLEELLRKYNFKIRHKTSDVFNVGESFFINNDWFIKKLLNFCRIIIIDARKK